MCNNITLGHFTDQTLIFSLHRT